MFAVMDVAKKLEAGVPADQALPLLSVLRHHKASIAVANSGGMSPAMLACAARDRCCIDALLGGCKKAELACAVAQQDTFGNTALHYACKSGNADAAEALLTAGMCLPRCSL